jgi:hypothetical protein
MQRLQSSCGKWGTGNSAADAAVAGEIPIVAFGELGIER